MLVSAHGHVDPHPRDRLDGGQPDLALRLRGDRVGDLLLGVRLGLGFHWPELTPTGKACTATRCAIVLPDDMSAAAPEVNLQQLRPLAIGEILDVAVKIVWRNAGTLMRVVFFVVFPVQVLSSFVQLSATPKDWTLQGFPPQFRPPADEFVVSHHEVWTYAAGFGSTLLLGFLAGIIATGACYRAITGAYLGEQIGWRGSLGYALRRFHSILWVTIASSFVAGLGLLLCIIPGIYLWVCFAVPIPVLLTEGTRGFKALGRSRSLVSGFWWRTFGILVLGAILAGFISSVLAGIVLGVTSNGTTSTTWLIATTIAGTLSKMISVPFTAAFVTVLYFDLRVRKEGFDLQLLAQRIGVDPGAAPLPFAPPVPPVSAQAPFWPPPPGWSPPAAGTAPPAAPPQPPSNEPPFWPPPPGWTPGGGDTP